MKKMFVVCACIMAIVLFVLSGGDAGPADQPGSGQAQSQDSAMEQAMKGMK